MFRGLSALTIDVKGRMALPTKHRDTIKADAEGEMVITIDTEERCLLLYTMPAWEKIEAKIEALPSFNKAARRIQRLLLGHATEVNIDANGRILIPQPLRDFAGIDKKIMLVGQGKKFELWDEAHWQAKREEWLAEDNISVDDLPTDLETLSL